MALFKNREQWGGPGRELAANRKKIEAIGNASTNTAAFSERLTQHSTAKPTIDAGQLLKR
jgi:hypothetical protein